MWLPRPRAFAFVAGVVGMVAGVLATPARATPLPTEPRDSGSCKGLAVQVRPAKAAFGKEKALAFDVTLKNVSDREFSVNTYGWWGDYVLAVHINGVPTGGPWVVKSTRKCEWVAIEEKDSRKLAPGECFTLQVPLYSVAFVPRETPEGAERLLHLSPGRYQATIHCAFDKNEVIKDDRPQYVGNPRSMPVNFVIATDPIAED